MKVRIQSDGTPRSMKITDAETGKLMEYITRLEIHQDAPDVYPHAILTAMSPVIDLVAEAEIRRVCPHCGHAHNCYPGEDS